MTKFIGRLVDVGLARETTRGVGVAPTYWVPKANIAIDDKVTKARSALSFGRVEGFGNTSLVAQRWAEGNIEGEVLGTSFGLIMYSLLGSLSTSGPSDSLYTHTFSVAQTNTHQSLSITVQDENATDIFELAMLDELELNFKPDDVVRFTARFVSKASAGSSGTPAYSTTEYKFLGRELSFKIASLTSGLSAASKIPVKSLVLRFRKNVVLDQALGTLDPVDILNRQLMIEGEIELDYTDRTYRNYMLNGDYKAVRIDLTNARDTIGVSARAQFTLDLSRCDFDQWESNRPNDEVATEKIQFFALYDQTNGNVINSCVLKNATSSY